MVNLVIYHLAARQSLNDREFDAIRVETDWRRLRREFAWRTHTKGLSSRRSVSTRRP